MKTIKIKKWAEVPVKFSGIVEWPNRTKHWCKKGRLHREDGPAIEYSTGGKEWYKEGKLHREDGPAVEWSDGTKKWFKEGILHREDGPALEWSNGKKEWYKEGYRHREDGPAIEFADGDKNWHINNIWYAQINLKDFLILDHYQGEYGIMWYKLLDKDKIIEYPDIPGMITK